MVCAPVSCGFPWPICAPSFDQGMVRTFRLFRGLNLLVKERMVGVKKNMVTQKVLKTESNLGHEAANETDSVYIYIYAI